MPMRAWHSTAGGAAGSGAVGADEREASVQAVCKSAEGASDTERGVRAAEGAPDTGRDVQAAGGAPGTERDVQAAQPTANAAGCASGTRCTSVGKAKADG
mmetsp:Transcript_22577/g.58061  ORF Transcript_22577/g.58061 Transcript_22577/m.58061 type:complete len:100 (-) Transcript_22577:1627-1926(-)